MNAYYEQFVEEMNELCGPIEKQENERARAIEERIDYMKSTRWTLEG